MQKQGANKGATTAFLISTPESGVDSIAITYALLDPVMTVIRPVAAFCTAIAAGCLENILNWSAPDKKHVGLQPCVVDSCCDGTDCSEEEHSKHHTAFEKLFAGLKYAVVDVWGDIALWFYAGLLIAAIITVLIPDALMVSLLGGGLGSMFVMLLIGVPLYICATASTPVAAALILKGVSPGAALVFLLVGPATNITSLSVLIGVLGKKSTVRYLSVLSVAAIVFGLAVDQFYTALGISPQAVIGEAAEIVPLWLKYLAVAVLLLFSVKPLWLKIQKMFVDKKEQTFVVSGLQDLRSAEKKSNDNVSLPAAGNGAQCDCVHHTDKASS